jgi:hypothetical protein
MKSEKIFTLWLEYIIRGCQDNPKLFHQKIFFLPVLFFQLIKTLWNYKSQKKKCLFLTSPYLKKYHLNKQIKQSHQVMANKEFLKSN